MNQRPRAERLALAGFAALACGGAAWFGLSALAAPSAFDGRRGELAAQVARLEQVAAAGRRPSAHGADAACPGIGDGDLGAVKQALSALASQSGVRLTDLVAAPPSQVADYGRLAPAGLRLQAAGPYESVREFLERLAEAKPEIFVDSLDLSTAAPDVKLKLSGKVFCWTSARH